ncbi:hypothetical protein JCM33374_g4742 [Metschnikowia sp. JCM 33374]|nr:hypothetical protein JCM33374_g4742 [Metschnikowia sp. JCM 33374]
MAFKALVASSDKECFMKYFPALESHFERFEACKSLISETIVRKFPVLLSTGELNPARVSDLAYVIQAISSAELESKTSVWRVAADESRVINLLIRQWKGNSQRGLNIIMTLAKEFEYKYRKTSRLHHINLLDMLDGFSEDATRQIEAWWGYNVLENPQWTAMRILQEFNDDVLRRYLVVHSLTRERRITSVSESEYAQFTKILQDKHCEDDFWDIQTISGPHSRRNFSMAEEIRRARAAARNHHPACHTAQGIPFMDVNGEMYKLFNGSVLSSTKGLFVLSNQAPVTVTDNKDHLVDLESFTDLSLNDTAGKEHRSQGKGKVLVNGHKLTCYWVPTYMSNVVSMGDIRKLPHHIVQDKYVFVKNVENKSATFVGRIKDTKSFDIRFVDTESMMFPGPNVSKAVQIHYGTHKDEEQTRRLCKMLKVPFGPEDAEAIKKCELCLSLAADDACEVD